MTPAVLGLRAHSGWAAWVAVGGTSRAPVALDRGRLELADPEERESLQPYHTAEGLPLGRAEKLLARYLDDARRRSARALGEVTASLRRRGHVLAGCGLLLGSGRSGSSLAAVLASHALIHTADGNHFRDALRYGCQRHALPVTEIVERELLKKGAALFRLSEERLTKTLLDLGRPLGPPWRQDEKYATLAACVVLGAPG